MSQWVEPGGGQRQDGREVARDLPLAISRLLQSASLQAADADRRVLQLYGLSPARFYALGHIASNGIVAATDLCQLMLCDKANVARLLDGLEQEGLVRRERDPADGRRVRVSLTEAGQARWAGADEAHRHSVREMMAPLDEEDQEALRRLLQALNEALAVHLAALDAR